MRARVAGRAEALRLAMRAALAVRAVAFQLAMRAGVAVHAVLFQLPVRAALAVRAEVLHPAMRARVTHFAVRLLPSMATPLVLAHRALAAAPRAAVCLRARDREDIVAFRRSFSSAPILFFWTYVATYSASCLLYTSPSPRDS